MPERPISNHDALVIYHELARLEYENFRPPVVEIHVSSKRLTVDGLKLWGTPVRRRDELPLNEGQIIVDGRPRVQFDFEAERA